MHNIVRGRIDMCFRFSGNKYLIREDLENSGNNHGCSYHTIMLKYRSCPSSPSPTPPRLARHDKSPWPEIQSRLCVTGEVP